LNDLAAARQSLGDLDLALKDFQSAKALRPDLLAPRIGEGDVLLAKNEYAAAIAAYTRARDIGEASAIYWYRGRANLAADRWAEALRDFEIIERRGEGNHFLAKDRGICLRKLGRLREAADVFSEILKDHPSDTEALGQRGWALFRLGEFDRAKADYIRYLKITPNDPRALFSLSLVYWQAGKLQIALDYMNRARAAGHPGAGSAAAELEAQIRALPPTSATTQPSATDSVDIASTGAETEPQVGAIGPSAGRDENSPESIWSDAVLCYDRPRIKCTKIARPPVSPYGTPEEEAAFFRHKYMPPFLPFVGSGKRLALDLSPVQKLAVAVAFPAFLGREVVDPRGAATPPEIAKLPEMFFPPGSRAAYKRDLRKRLQRRYSGDSHEPLPRSRYIALHGEQSTADTYTLLGEMNAYTAAVLTGYCAAVPSGDPDSIAIVFRGLPDEPNPLWSFVTNPDRYPRFAGAWNDPRSESLQAAKPLISEETEFKVIIPCERVALSSTSSSICVIATRERGCSIFSRILQKPLTTTISPMAIGWKRRLVRRVSTCLSSRHGTPWSPSLPTGGMVGML
jgi:tetratricopeptide (TPR) repeat protein